VYQFQGCTFNYVSIGLEYAQWIQGVTVSQSNFTGGQNGIVVPGSQPGLDELLVWGNQFNVTQNGILIQGVVENTQIFGNTFLVYLASGATGINLTNPGVASIIGNSMEGTTGTSNNGIVINGNTNSWPTTISGNAIINFALNGIVLGNTSKNVNVQSNGYSGNGTNVSNAGTGNTLGGGSP
jgi:hypothetical protein